MNLGRAQPVPPEPEPELEHNRERGALVAWRLEQLSAAGYTSEALILLAERTDVDLRRATRLLAEGCPVATALRILL